MRFLALSLLVLLSPAAQAASSTVAYYFGQVIYGFDDSEHDFTAVSLVKRTVSPEKNKIEEVVVEKDDKAGSKGREFPTVLKRVSKEDFTIEMQYVEGRLSFSGPEWNWDNWTYDLTMTLPQEEAIRQITGAGLIRAGDKHIVTAKMIRVVQGENVLMTINRTEDLAPISAAEYQRRRAELLK